MLDALVSEMFESSPSTNLEHRSHVMSLSTRPFGKFYSHAIDTKKIGRKIEKFLKKIRKRINEIYDAYVKLRIIEDDLKNRFQ
jgi:hypothetical protein